MTIPQNHLQFLRVNCRYSGHQFVIISSLRHQLLEEVIKTLQSISDFFHGDQHANDSVQSLPQDILAFKSEMHSTEQEIDHTAGRINDLMLRISQTYKAFEEEIKQAKSTTFPAFDAARVASNDLLAATIETALIKLSLIQAKTERKLYGPQVANRAEPSKTVAKALEVAFASLKKEEKELEKESCALDAQLHEYESLLQFVDGGTGGYRQVVDDWTKVKKETNECKKDLRRLGWTGD
ncbi:hypothetical protein B0H34DRAFT_412126 [Crassisporium funariophilum]|nr:hypothetical protein B0H34DRAFT_412126 [Crassisporium funariophilum]